MTRRRAFALPPVLLLAALCVAVACLCRSAAGLAGVSASVSLRRARCQLAALAAARLGVGVVAQAMGPDARWSGQGPAGACWSARRAGEAWAVESLEGRHRAGDAELSWVARDLSCGCDLAAPVLARERALGMARRPRMRQRLASGATQPDAPQGVLSAARVADLAGLRAGVVAANGPWVAGARAVLVDPRTGAWRENLSVPKALSKRLGGRLADALLAPSATLRDQPARGMEPMDVGEGSARLRHMPLVADIALSMGVFNARSDGRHRVRMHVQMALWNPSALGLLTNGEKRLFLAEVEGAPEVSVTNLDSGATFTTWLDRCPPGVFWGYTQGVRERSLWWWVEVLDATRHGMSRSGILPGEVHAVHMPDPATQPYGFSRVIGQGTWRYDDAEHPAGWVRPSPDVFLPRDRIVVAMRFVTQGTTLRLHPYVGPLDASVEAADYPSPALLTLAHVPWPDGRVELSGAEYSRVDSAGYVIGERRFRWRARLSAEDDGQVLALAADPALMSGDIDLADAARRARWVLTADPVVEALAPVELRGSGMLWDAVENRHEALVDGAFADWRLRDVPVDPPLDVASLRHLTGVIPGLWMPELDRAFFSCPEPSTDLPVSENPRLAPWRPATDAEGVALLRQSLCDERAAEVFALEGPFNINATDPAAWEAFLASDPVRWAADAGGPAPPGKFEASAAFFSQPTGAMLAKYASSAPCDLDDEARRAMDPRSLKESARRQSARAPTPEALRRVCEKLVEEMGRHPGPFAGVEPFLASGVLDRAIAGAGLNEGLPAGSPLQVDAATLLGAHMALLVSRGDSFAVVGEGRAGGGTMALELTVQRLPEPAAHPCLGRRLAVVRARWLDIASR